MKAANPGSQGSSRVGKSQASSAIVSQRDAGSRLREAEPGYSV